MSKKIKDPPQTSRLWRDDTDRFPDDHLLRRLGWIIMLRPDKGDATWWMRLPNGKRLEEKHSALMHQIIDAEKGM